MTNTLPDFSGKIDKVAVSALDRIHQITFSMSIPLFIVGATARDILLEIHHGIRSKRATVDIDIAVFIMTTKQALRAFWEEIFRKLRIQAPLQNLSKSSKENRKGNGVIESQWTCSKVVDLQRNHTKK